MDRPELAQGWVALADSPLGTHGYATLPMTDEIAGRPVLLALDPEGRRHVLLPAETEMPEDLSSAGVKVRRLELRSDGVTEAYGAVRCEYPRLSSLFDDVAIDLVEAAVAAPSNPVGAAIAALDEWRALLRTVRSKGFSVSQLAGLLAELHFVIEVVAADPERRIDCWVGREGQRHDLRRGEAAIEVKATLSSEGRMVLVHGLEQLEPPDGGALHLAWARFERVPSGKVSLAGLIDELRSLGVPAHQIHSGLDERGLPPGQGVEERFELREDQIYVVNDGFPRITQSRLRGARLEGVHDVRYSVDLDVAADCRLETDLRAQMIKKFATTHT